MPTFKERLWALTNADVGVTLSTDHLKIHTIRWVAPAGVPGNVAKLTDPVTGNVLWESVIAGANFTEESVSVDTWWPNGFKLTTLDAGTLYVTLC